MFKKLITFLVAIGLVASAAIADKYVAKTYTPGTNAYVRVIVPDGQAWTPVSVLQDIDGAAQTNTATTTIIKDSVTFTGPSLSTVVCSNETVQLLNYGTSNASPYVLGGGTEWRITSAGGVTASNINAYLIVFKVDE